MKITVKNLRGEAVRDIEVADAIFDYPYKEHLIHTVVRAILAARRAGTHSTKTRGEVSASGKKPWRQKGTGRARVGSTATPLWRGGGTVHGPKPRSYAMKVSVREKKNALKSALSRKLAEECLVVLDSLELESHKTKALSGTLSGLGVKKALLVDTRDNANLERAARNNPRLKTVDALGVNVYDVIGRDHVLFSEPALERLVEVLSA
jgi:large subunit ribosomal protein L4